MRIKNNPWVSMVALLLLAVILVLTCAGCAADTVAAAETEPTPASRFAVECAGEGFPYISGFYIITDNQTGVQYLFVDKVDGSGLVKLEG